MKFSLMYIASFHLLPVCLVTVHGEFPGWGFSDLDNGQIVEAQPAFEHFSIALSPDPREFEKIKLVAHHGSPNPPTETT